MSGVEKEDSAFRLSKAKNAKTKKESVNYKDLAPLKEAKKKPANAKIATYSSIATPNSTQFLKQDAISLEYYRITRREYEGYEETISSSSETYHCKYGSEGKVYSQKGLLNRNLVKELDPQLVRREWIDPCPPFTGEKLMEMLMFFVTDNPEPPERFQHRWHETLDAFCKYTAPGYNIRDLDSICVILDFLVENKAKQPYFMEYLERLYSNMNKPILLKYKSDAITYVESLQSYFTFVDYLLASTVDDSLFSLLASGLQFQLSAPDTTRGPGTLPLSTALAVATTTYQTITRMLGVCADNRFCSFLNLANILAMHSVENCLNMMMENILENIFFRFNPYFPNKKLKSSEISPYKIPSTSYQVGPATENLSSVMNLLLVLLKTTMDILKEIPSLREQLPVPQPTAQTCLSWSYRYECRMPDHRHQRNTMTTIITGLMNIFGCRLRTFSHSIMRDVLSMAVMSEVKPQEDWLADIPFNAGQEDVWFKHRLISLSLIFLKEFPTNVVFIERYRWVLGLMYLLDPGLTSLRVKWSAALFSRIRKTAMQGLIVAIPISRTNLVEDYGLIRRILWYIEWYPDNPYDLTTLYWCVRLLQVSLYCRTRAERVTSTQQLLDTHGVIILLHLCNTLLRQHEPPVEKIQCIISVILRILTTTARLNQNIICVVYPGIPWPKSLTQLSENMIDIVTYSVNKDIYIGERWVVSLLNFTRETIIWNDDNRTAFLKNNGLYKLLDMIPKVSSSSQCIALALICDIAVSGDAISQLVTWRAKFNVSYAQEPLVKPGSTIAALLAAIFRDECQKRGIALTKEGILINSDLPMKTNDYQILKGTPLGYENLDTIRCKSAASMAGSRLSKVFAILHMLSRDLHYKVTLLDETYNTYKNVKLSLEDEIALIAVSHYLTLKLNEAWQEILVLENGLAMEDEDTLEEFIQMGRGWTSEIIRQQTEVLQNTNKKELDEENSLYEFLSRIRLNLALDALHVVRRATRSTDRDKLVHDMLHDAVRAHQRFVTAQLQRNESIIRTYTAPLDDQEMIGQHVRVAVLNKISPITSCFNNAPRL